MIFNSLEFLAFFVVVLGAYWWLPHRAQNVFLLAASYLFYGTWDWRFLGLIAVSTLVDYAVARGLAESEDPRRRKLLLATSLAVNLGILGFFKYVDFFAASFADLAALVGWRVDAFTLGVVLPVGISFYTFQTLSYTIDVYRRELEPTRDLLDFALFVAFFPQLVAGPIERAGRLLPQIRSPRIASLAAVQEGAWLILWGFVKKVVIADNLSGLVDLVYAPNAEPTAAQIALATVGFALQIYCDFSGYSNIARGAARLLGFRLMVNFAWPYLSRDIAVAWQRWHISFTIWLRDYVYRTLRDRDRARFGRRLHPLRTGLNVMITFILCGLWHGAGWNYVVWGAAHGLWLILSRLWAGRRQPRERSPRERNPRIRQLTDLASGVLTFTVICLTFVFFRATDLTHAATLFAALAPGTGAGWTFASIEPWLEPFLLLTLPLWLMETVQKVARDELVVFRLPLVARAVLYAGLVLLIVHAGQDFGQPFIYFQF